MPQAISYNQSGVKSETVAELNTGIFATVANHELVAQAYRLYLANARSAGANTLKRGEVAGGGRKPWRQKGTGRARVGSIRVPNWRGGGIVFGPTGNENYTFNMNVKAKRAALRHALTLKASAGVISIIEKFDSVDGKAKDVSNLMAKLGFNRSVVLVVEDKTDLIRRATRNIPYLTVVSSNYLNVFTIMNAHNIIFTPEALASVETWLGENV